MDMMTEIADLFTLHGGSILDLYSGSMSVEMTCMKNGRGCVSIEKIKNVLKGL